MHKDEEKYAQHSALDIDLDIIYRTLGKKSNKRVSKEGIRHRNTHFLSLEMWEQITIGDEVEVRENINDSNKLFLFKDGAFICEIQDKQVMHVMIGLSVEDIKANKKAYKQRVVKAVKQRTKQAQKTYKQHQDAMPDEYLDIEQAQVDLRKQTKQEKQKSLEQTDFQKLVLELVANE
ncbi:Mu transposase C-terminal domain-containing protein [Abyssogena phaseoliformis symbiont]|uniref:Mu transposase C-terminal domain-containing protein n=1 Tax=Abyssogena phaseoliformis symbiont TaxID=596095 RepID=UPI0019169E4F|nr:Mu transposase C-terminal domain-containing protein [Abyssogena phaseoliformis symbiont]